MTNELPLVVFPRHSQQAPLDSSSELRACADRYLRRVGSILFRGFRSPGRDGFRLFASSFGQSQLVELDASHTARGELEHARTSSGGWPLRLWLQGAAGGTCSTLLCDGREVFRRIPARLRARLVDRGLLCVRDFERGEPPGAGALGLDRLGIEAWCRARGVRCEWRADGGLRTRQHSPAALAHPLTGDLVWFNPDIGGTRSIVYGDGTAIEEGALAEIQSIFEEVSCVLDWEEGDVLLLDNLLMARAPLGLRSRAPHPALEGDATARAPLALCAGPFFLLAETGNAWVEESPEWRGGRSAFDRAQCR